MRIVEVDNCTTWIMGCRLREELLLQTEALKLLWRVDSAEFWRDSIVTVLVECFCGQNCYVVQCAIKVYHTLKQFYIENSNQFSTQCRESQKIFINRIELQNNNPDETHQNETFFNQRATKFSTSDKIKSKFKQMARTAPIRSHSFAILCHRKGTWWYGTITSTDMC